MGLLNDKLTQGLNATGFSSDAGVKSPTLRGPDFPSGMTITEIIDGAPRTIDEIKLVGRFMPLQPFEFGGEQRMVRQEYAGSSEPTVQVLGPKETDVTISCEFRTNKFRGNPAFRDAAQEYQELIDAMRIRGNLVKIVMGEWRRYGFIKASKFKIWTLQKIDADITFEITGFNPPKGWRIVQGADVDLIKPNKEVTNAAAAYLASAKNYPKSMPLTMAEVLNREIGDVANSISKVTKFVEGIVDDSEKLVGSANRAIGLIKNARATISKTKRQLGAIVNNVGGIYGTIYLEKSKTIGTIESLGSNYPDRALGVASIRITSHMASSIKNMSNLGLLLAELQKRFASYVTQTPFRRHLIRNGDTLQNVSMKYYKTADNWKKIYEHNKLTSSVLVIGSVLEIPKI